ncbi:MAG: hypothetical protein IPJ76_01775 [Flavobacteriales bacterium]|nr:MAG: hypothetical protein IPJ76_01775 [Flavobacteriales bacterium]
MKAIDLIAPVLAGALATLALAWIGRQNSAPPGVQDGMLRFRMPKAFVVVGWVSISLSAFMAAGAVFQLIDAWPFALLSVLLAAMFGWLGVLLVRDGRHHQAACNESILAVVDRNNELKSYRWEELRSARLHPVSKMIILTTQDGTRMSVSAYLIGSDALFRIMARRTRLPVKDLVERARAIS